MAEIVIMLTNKRLLKIIENFPVCETAADIGCDHGKLAVELVKRKLAKKVIASDISEASLSKAKKAAFDAGVSDRVRCVCANGLDSVSDDNVDAIVIAGMGGILIADILKAGIEAAKKAKLCLCPHTNEAYLRRFLYENGFSVYKEIFMKEDGKYYQLIFAQPVKTDFASDEDFEFGDKSSLVLTDEYFEYVENRVSCIEKEISAMIAGGADEKIIAKKKKIIDMAKRRMEWRSL